VAEEARATTTTARTIQTAIMPDAA
jgi:hypothetical protein